MSQKLKALTKAGKTALPEAFAKCKTQAEKTQFFCAVYLLDPEISAKRVGKKDTQTEEDRDDRSRMTRSPVSRGFSLTWVSTLA